MIQYFSLNSYCKVRLSSMNLRIRIFKPFNKFSLPAESAAGTLFLSTRIWVKNSILLNFLSAMVYNPVDKSR